MTKFERAKHMTLIAWKRGLDSLCGVQSFGSLHCGFCTVYKKGPLDCGHCPIRLANNGRTCSNKEYLLNIRPNFGDSVDLMMMKVLAILTYIHSLTEEGCIRPEEGRG